MLGYVTVGTSDLQRSAKFYDAIAKELGVGRISEKERFIAWGRIDGLGGIAAILPNDGNPASVGNGVMLALKAKDHGQVQRLYDIALANGGSDEGPVGTRGAGYYAGYFRDPDGNKLNAYCMG